MIQRFLKYINKNKLFNSTNKLLLTVSGGLDSVVLAHLLFEANFKFSIAHCNFQLRENDSVLDEQFVCDLAQKLDVEFYSIKFDTEKFQSENGISIQMAARELRYEWFEEIKSKHDFDYIVTAHHANDQLETVLFNLSKGTGLRGVRGMKPHNNGLVRPLLFCTRSEIEEFASLNQLSWREDRSNSSTKYKRNAIRHLVVPELKKINPNIENSVLQFTDNMRQLENLLQEQVSNWKHKIVKINNNTIYIDLLPLDGVEYRSLILFEILHSYGFENSKEIVESPLNFTGKNFYSEKYHLVVDRDQLVIVELNNKELYFEEYNLGNVEISTPFGGFKIDLLDSFSIASIQKNKNIIYIDVSKIKGKLIFRTWKQGDAIKPLGMKGKSQKVSDILINLKVPVNLKSQVLVLENNTKIVWVVGYKVSDEFKVDDFSKAGGVASVSFRV